MSTFWIILTGSLAASACALVGSFLVLRKMSMLGDAISHAVLPGIVLAFLVSGSRAPLPMILGAGAFGVLTSFVIETLHRRGKLQQDASIGVTFTWLFALGVILVSLYAGKIDLDADCVLYGVIDYVPLDLWIVGDGISMGPRAVWMLGGVFLLVLTFVVFGFKELNITSFDPALATSLGISATLWHYLLMSMVSITTVGAFESVGAILVVAMLIAPASTAYLLTGRLRSMLVLAVVSGLLSVIGGYYLAVWIDGSIAAAIAVMAGFQFLLALLFGPAGGILSRRLRNDNEAPPPEMFPAAVTVVKR